MTSTEAALIYTMVLVSASDRNMSDQELGKIGNIVQHLPVFKDYDPNLLLETARGCAEILSADEGLDTVLGLVKSALDEDLRETAYALAIEVAAADGIANQAELRILEIIRHELDIDRLIAAGIERGARARYIRS